MLHKLKEEREKNDELTEELDHRMDMAAKQKGGCGRDATIKKGLFDSPHGKALKSAVIENWLIPYGGYLSPNSKVYGEDSDDFSQVFLRTLGFFDDEPDISLPAVYKGNYEPYWVEYWGVINATAMRFRQGVQERITRVLQGNVFVLIIEIFWLFVHVTTKY